MANLDVAKPQLFDGALSKVSGFIIGCKLYIRNKLAGATVEEQMQWILSHVQGESADVWKENILEDLEVGEVEYESAGKFLVELKREFGGGDGKVVKVAELKKLKQGGRTMEEFVQEFKREMNRVIRRKLMEVENQPGSIEQWFRRAMALN